LLRYARKFTPLKSDSFRSDLNRKRYAKLEALGMLAPAGRERAPRRVAEALTAH